MCNDGKHVRIKCKYFTWSAAYIRFVILRYGCSTVYFSTKFKDFKIWVSMQQDWTCNSVGFRKLNSGATLCAKHWTVWSTWWWILLYVNILGDVTCVLMSELFFGGGRGWFIVWSNSILNCSTAWHCLYAVYKYVHLVCYKVQVGMI